MTAQANNNGSTLVHKILLYTGVLSAVCLGSAAGISTLYVVNKDRISQNELKSFRQTLAVVLGEAENATPLVEGKKEGEAQFYAAPLDGRVRYVARGAQQGYQSKVTVLVTVDAPANQPLPEDPKIFRVAVVSSGETPGLGENINKVQKNISLWGVMIGHKEKGGSQRPWFQDQFSHKNLSDLHVEKSSEKGITPITGATITSQATTTAVREAVTGLIEKTRQLYGTNQ